MFFRLSEIVSKMLAKTSFRKVRKSLLNTVSKMTRDFSGGPEGRSKATFFWTEIVQRAPRTRPFEPQNGIWALGAFFASREASLKGLLGHQSGKMKASGPRNHLHRGTRHSKYHLREQTARCNVRLTLRCLRRLRQLQLPWPGGMREAVE